MVKDVQAEKSKARHVATVSAIQQKLYLVIFK